MKRPMAAELSYIRPHVVHSQCVSVLSPFGGSGPVDLPSSVCCWSHIGAEEEVGFVVVLEGWLPMVVAEFKWEFRRGEVAGKIESTRGWRGF